MCVPADRVLRPSPNTSISILKGVAWRKSLDAKDVSLSVELAPGWGSLWMSDALLTPRLPQLANPVTRPQSSSLFRGSPSPKVFKTCVHSTVTEPCDGREGTTPLGRESYMAATPDSCRQEEASGRPLTPSLRRNAGVVGAPQQRSRAELRSTCHRWGLRRARW